MVASSDGSVFRKFRRPKRRRSFRVETLVRRLRLPLRAPRARRFVVGSATPRSRPSLCFASPLSIAVHESRRVDYPPPCMSAEAQQAPDTPAPLTRPSSQLDHLAELYRQMLVIRRVEEEAARAYAQGKIGGFLHLYIGQEAVAVGALAALKPDDYVVTTYRDHGVAIAKGMSPKAVMAELYGKVTGCSKGLGGSMHMFD